MFESLFESLSKFYQSIFKVMKTLFNTMFKIIKVIINKIIFLIKLGFALFFTFIGAIFYKNNKINKNININ